MRSLILGSILVLVLGLTGCEEETTRYIEVDYPPAVPQGVYSVTGDEAVYIFWLPVQDEDLDYYRVWWSDEADGLYELVGTSEVESYIDTEVSNGVTYFYAVSAVDWAGKESDLSYETVYDTPRPEGTNLFLTDFNVMPDDAGFDFSRHLTVPYNSDSADIFLEYDSGPGVFFLNARNIFTDIQDMGFTYDFDEISVAPDTTVGWSAVGWVELLEGHTYVIWTADDHFAKLRVYNIIGTTGAQFQWAYQEAVGNPELARPQHDEEYLRHTVEMTLLK